MTAMIEQIHQDNYGVHGARKIWHELRRRGVEVARCTVERLMRESGLRGLLRDKSPRTTRPAAETRRPGDLVKRDFTMKGLGLLVIARVLVASGGCPSVASFGAGWPVPAMATSIDILL
ncbi:IS3 family transposase [Micromonospora sp. NPDC050187]|uniref:IS3 family transposase n=1 Tax=Micromonospora sp. NPDC050187 TaxID=3364277 RepID=UPI0037A3ED64